MKKVLRDCHKTFSILLVLVTAFSMCIGKDFHVHAQEASVDDDLAVFDSDFSKAPAGSVMIGVRGTYSTMGKKAVLLKINKMRYMACYNHEKYPHEWSSDPDRNLSLDNDYGENPTEEQLSEKNGDYIPVKWSNVLEKAARLRAAEAAQYNAHIRPAYSSKGGYHYSWDTVTSGSQNEENLAFSGDMSTDIDDWYSEREDYVNNVSGAVTGHYTNMIYPRTGYIGVATFTCTTDEDGKNKSYYSSSAFEGMYSDGTHANNVSEDAVDDSENTECIQKMPYRSDFEDTSGSKRNRVSAFKIKGVSQICPDKTAQLTPCAKVNASNAWWRITDGVTWKSSDEDVLTVDENGKVAAHNEGEATITATADSKDFTKTITVGHDWGEWTPDPNDDTQCIKTCSICGATKTKDHDFKCVDQNDGTHKQVCNDCKYATDASEHDWSEKPVLDEDDHTKHQYTCKECGAVKSEEHNFGDPKEIDDNDEEHELICKDCDYAKKEKHSYGNWVYDEKTGTSTRECEDCHHKQTCKNHNYKIETSKTNDTQHVLKCSICRHEKTVDHDYEVTDSDGSSHTLKCKICNHTITEDHKFGEWYENKDKNQCERKCEVCGYKENKDHEFTYENNGDGTHLKKCKDCNASIINEPHEYTKNDVKEIENDDAYHSIKCDDCDYKKKEAHSYGEAIEINNNDKQHYVKCDDCGHKKYENHDYGDWTYDTDNQVATRTCKDCGHVQTESTHKYGDWNYIDEDHCQRTCEDCGITETQAHVTEIVDNGDGTHSEKCENCGHSFTKEKHVWGEAKQKTKDDGEYDDQVHEYKCEVCGATKDKKHNYETHQVKEIKDDDTNHYVVCDDCGYKKFEKHTYGEAVEDKDNDEQHYVKCDDCGHKKYVNHNYGEWTYDTDNQVATRTCEDCTHVQTETTHDYGDWAYVDKNHCQRKCKDCGIVETKAHVIEFVDNGDGTHSLKCKHCGYVSPASVTHTYDDHNVEEIDGNDEKHYVKCDSCDHKKYEDHDYGNWTYDTDNQVATRTCKDCGHVQTEKDHDYGAWTSATDTTHQKTCNSCGIVLTQNHDLHYVNNGDGTHTAVCDTCGYKANAENHNWSAWSTSGSDETRTCVTCGATETRVVTNPTRPVTPTPTPKPSTTTPAQNIQNVTQSITSRKNDSDPADATYSKLTLKSSKVTKSSIKITWMRATGAKNYLVYGGKCGTKYTFIRQTGALSYMQSKLKKGTYYKYLVIAVDANGKKIATSKVIHVATRGGKNANVTRITVNKKSIKLKKKKSFKLRIRIKKDARTLRNHRKISYESSNAKVATVNGSGRISAKNKGKAVIYIYAQNGYCKKVNVTVR